MGIKQTEMVLIVFIFSMFIIAGFVIFFLDKYSNHIRIQILKIMVWRDKNNYQKIFNLLKKVRLTESNRPLDFRVSYFKTFGKNYRQYTFENEMEEPFVSLIEMKKCNNVDDIKKIIDSAKKTVKVVYTCRPSSQW